MDVIATAEYGMPVYESKGVIPLDDNNVEMVAAVGVPPPVLVCTKAESLAMPLNHSTRLFTAGEPAKAACVKLYAMK